MTLAEFIKHNPSMKSQIETQRNLLNAAILIVNDITTTPTDEAVLAVYKQLADKNKRDDIKSEIIAAIPELAKATMLAGMNRPN